MSPANLDVLSPNSGIIILGCYVNQDGSCTDMLAKRVQCGVKCFHRNLAEGHEQTIVVTGHCSGGPVTEAKAAKNLCLKLGIPEDKIVLEEKASNTIENAIFTKPIAKRLGIKKAIVVTSDFHMPRSKIIFDSVYENSGIQLTYEACSSDLSPEQKIAMRVKEELSMSILSQRLKMYLQKEEHDS